MDNYHWKILKKIDSLFVFISAKDVRHRVAKLEADRDKLQAQLNEAQAEREKSMKETEITSRIIMLANRLSTYRLFHPWHGWLT